MMNQARVLLASFPEVKQVVSQVVVDVSRQPDQNLTRRVRKNSLDGADDDERRTENRERVGVLWMVVGQQEAQRNLRQPAELRKGGLGAFDAIHDGADHQGQQCPRNSHAGLRQHSENYFALMPADVWV